MRRHHVQSTSHLKTHTRLVYCLMDGCVNLEACAFRWSTGRGDQQCTPCSHDTTLYVGPTFEHTLVHFNSHTRAMPTLARISDVPHDSLQ